MDVALASMMVCCVELTAIKLLTYSEFNVRSWGIQLVPSAPPGHVLPEMATQLSANAAAHVVVVPSVAVPETSREVSESAWGIQEASKGVVQSSPEMSRHVWENVWLTAQVPVADTEMDPGPGVTTIPECD